MFPFFGGLNGDGYEPDLYNDAYIPGEDGWSGYTQKPVQCRVCKSISVYWTQVCGIWVLFDKNTDLKTQKDACHSCHRRRFEAIKKQHLKSTPELSREGFKMHHIMRSIPINNNFPPGTPVGLTLYASYESLEEAKRVLEKLNNRLEVRYVIVSNVGPDDEWFSKIVKNTRQK
jgi:hypothetical protein